MGLHIFHGWAGNTRDQNFWWKKVKKRIVQYRQHKGLNTSGLQKESQ